MRTGTGPSCGEKGGTLSEAGPAGRCAAPAPRNPTTNPAAYRDAHRSPALSAQCQRGARAPQRQPQPPLLSRHVPPPPSRSIPTRSIALPALPSALPLPLSRPFLPQHPGSPPPGPPAAHPGACMRPMMAAVQKKEQREGEALLPPERTSAQLAPPPTRTPANKGR